MSKIKLNNVRLSFPTLWEAEAYKDSKPAYSATFLVPKDSPQGKALIKAARDAAIAKWGEEKGPKIFESIKGNKNKFNIQDGDLSEYDGYEGCWAVRAKRTEDKGRLKVFDRDRSPLVQADGRPYGGCYVNAVIEFFGYDNTGKGVSASLNGIQFSKDGTPFTGGAAATEDDFDDLTDTGEGEDVDDLMM